MTDQLEKVFAGLRAEALTEIRPPGVDVARRTVRRRRAATSTAVTLVVVAVVAGLVVGLRPGAEVPGPAADRAPEAWAESAAGAIGLDLDAPVMGGLLLATITSVRSAVGGLYRAEAACVGQGSVTVTFETVARGHANQAQPVEVPCAAAAQTRAVWITVPGTEGDVLARSVPSGRASVAYRLTLAQVDRYRLQDLADGAFKSKAPPDLQLGWGDFVDRGGTAANDATVRPGWYRVSVACAGVSVGTVLVTVDGVPRPASSGRTTTLVRTRVSCSPTPRVTSETFMVPDTPALMLTATVDPSLPAQGQAATSLRIERM